MDAPPIARDYEGFRALLNNRRMELSLSMNELNHLAGLQSGYSEKLLSSTLKKDSHYQRNIGPAVMGKLLTALGVGIRLEQTLAGCEFPRGAGDLYPHQKLLRERARKGGLASYAQMHSRERAAFHKAAGLASGAARRALAKKKRKRRAARPIAVAAE